MPNMEEMILSAARELEIKGEVTVRFKDGTADPFVTITYPPRNGFTIRVDARFMMEESLAQLKIILGDVDREAKEQKAPATSSTPL